MTTKKILGRVQNVKTCVKAILEIPPTPDYQRDPSAFLRVANGRMTACPVDGWIATYSRHIHVPGVGESLHRGNPIPDAAIQEATSRLFTPGIVPCDFDSTSTCPRWEQFVTEVCP